jgi:ADP-ribosyl-[dinitrogen reductase] hydrolase
MSLHCVYVTNNSKEAMLLAANTCGDADTIAAITGQIAGAIYGASTIPEKWVSLVEKWDGGGRIAQLAHCLFYRKPAIRD